MKRILIDDWRANRLGYRFLKLGKYADSGFVDLIGKLEEKLPDGCKLKVSGRYNCGYGIPFEEEDYNMKIKIKEKQLTLLQEHFSKPIYEDKVVVKKNLDFYGKVNTSEISDLIINDFFDKNPSFNNTEPVES